MALIKCTECGHDVSDRAAACPNCGCPMEEIQKDLVKAAECKEQEYRKKVEAANREREESGRIFDIEHIGRSVELRCHFCATTTSLSKREFSSATETCCSPTGNIKCPGCGRVHKRGMQIYKPSSGVPSENRTSVTICCPHCGSSEFDLLNGGISMGATLLGGMIFGSAGALAGAAGSQKVKRVCRKCGTEF